MVGDQKHPQGTDFYRSKGLRLVSLRLPSATLIKLKVYASKMNRSLYDTVQSIINHYLEHPDLYKVSEDDLWNGETELSTAQAFVAAESHQGIKIQSIYAGMAMKHLAGRVVYEYLEKHCRVKLGGDSWRSTKAPGDSSGGRSRKRKRKKSAS